MAIVVIDIETENTGYDIKEDNKKIISVQFYDGIKEEFYYEASSTNNLEIAKARIKTLLDNDIQFAGYNIIYFDLPLITKFLGIEIPLSRVIDISEMKSIIFLKNQLNKKGVSLEEACNNFGIKCEHKKLLEPIINKIKQLPEVIDMANVGGLRLANKNGWSIDFSRRYALNKISGGMAILESYKEFVNNNGSPDSIFYRYAIGDVVTEYELYQKLKNN